MASTRTLQQTVQWAQTLTQMVPIIGVSGYENEPALTICNQVIQEMLSPPYNWKFNSVDAPVFSTDTDANTQDYIQTITDLGWLESALREDASSTLQPKPLDIITVVRTLQKSSDVSYPLKIAAMYETDAGITMRLWPVPSLSKQWNIYTTYQKKPPLKTGLQETWAPFPDELSFAFEQGFLAMAYKHADDPRYAQEYLKFQAMMQKALGLKDAEMDSSGFVPDFGLFIG